MGVVDEDLHATTETKGGTLTKICMPLRKQRTVSSHHRNEGRCIDRDLHATTEMKDNGQGWLTKICMPPQRRRTTDRGG